MIDKHVSVYIDADNVSASVTDKALELLTSVGAIKRISAYGNFSARPKNWRDVCSRWNISMSHHYNVARSKNASDISLVVDATANMYRGWGTDYLAVISSDADFIPLVLHAKAQGTKVIGIGLKKAPQAYKDACDIWVTIEDLVNTSLTNLIEAA